MLGNESDVRRHHRIRPNLEKLRIVRDQQSPSGMKVFSRGDTCAPKRGTGCRVGLQLGGRMRTVRASDHSWKDFKTALQSKPRYASESFPVRACELK